MDANTTRDVGTADIGGADDPHRAWPSWATEPIEIEPPSPHWPELAAQLIADLKVRLAGWLDGEVEHVGSTAVPGLPAKPIVDLLAPCVDLAAADEADGRLVDAGWRLVPPALDQRPWRRFHVLPRHGRRLAHLQLVERDHPRFAEVLVFRDALRADPSLAAEYAAVKRSAAAAHPDDREAYTSARSELIRRVLGGPGRPDR